jgi:uncharacterized protein (TIGR00304 family)
MGEWRSVKKIYILPLVSIFLFILSEIILFLLGFIKVYFVLFIPVFVSTSPISLIPLALFFIPIIVLFLSFLHGNRDTSGREESYYPWEERNFRGEEKAGGEQEMEKGKASYGGLLMIGPVPIVFGKGVSEKALIALVILVMIIMIIWFLFAR